MLSPKLRIEEIRQVLASHNASFPNNNSYTQPQLCLRDVSSKSSLQPLLLHRYLTPSQNFLKMALLLGLVATCISYMGWMLGPSQHISRRSLGGESRFSDSGVSSSSQLPIVFPHLPELRGVSN